VHSRINLDIGVEAKEVWLWQNDPDKAKRRKRVYSGEQTKQQLRETDTHESVCGFPARRLKEEGGTGMSRKGER
jgi:hypothetical protein